MFERRPQHKENGWRWEQGGIQTEGIEDYEHSPKASSKNEEKEDSPERPTEPSRQIALQRPIHLRGSVPKPGKAGRLDVGIAPSTVQRVRLVLDHKEKACWRSVLDPSEGRRRDVAIRLHEEDSAFRRLSQSCPEARLNTMEVEREDLISAPSACTL